jgi:phosphate uptake regulator
VVDSAARVAELVDKIRDLVSSDLEKLITQITLDTL